MTFSCICVLLWLCVSDGKKSTPARTSHVLSSALLNTLKTPGPTTTDVGKSDKTSSSPPPPISRRRETRSMSRASSVCSSENHSPSTRLPPITRRRETRSMSRASSVCSSDNTDVAMNNVDELGKSVWNICIDINNVVHTFQTNFC